MSSSSILRVRGSRARRCGDSVSWAAGRIVYVSCNPTTLASDAKVLLEEFGYELVRCRPRRHVPAHAARGVRHPPREARLVTVCYLACAARGLRRRPVRRARGDRGSRGGSRSRRREARAGPTGPRSTRGAASGEQPGHREPRQADPEPESLRGGEEEREEDDVGWPDVGRRSLARAHGSRRRSPRRSPASPRSRTSSARTRPTRCRPTARGTRRW